MCLFVGWKLLCFLVSQFCRGVFCCSGGEGGGVYQFQRLY